ncbi:MAG: hypothetical protein ABH808_00740 [Candidatus Kuenenbacteria bacterium]
MIEKIFFEQPEKEIIKNNEENLKLLESLLFKLKDKRRNETR